MHLRRKTSNNLAAKLTRREKLKSQITHKTRFVSVQNKMAPVLSNFYDIGRTFSRVCLRIILFLFAQFIVSNLLVIMATFVFKNTQRQVLVLAVKIDFLEPNHVRDLEPSLATL